jgi:hypothetical protein
MPSRQRVAIGTWLFFFSAVMIAHLVWVWSFAARLVPKTADAPVPQIRVHWFWMSFSPTVEWTLLLVVIFAAGAGSAAHLSLVFANRYGHNTLQTLWSWWYVLRPGAAVIVGIVAYVVLRAGFLGTVTDTDQQSLAFAAAVGALAGMFTDTLIKKLQSALGASAFELPTATDAGRAQEDTVGRDSTQQDTTQGNGHQAVAQPEVAPAPRTHIEGQPEQTDNRPRPEDGIQDVDQELAPYPGSPTGDEGLDEPEVLQ